MRRGFAVNCITQIFKDKGMLLSMVLWVVLVVVILYGVPDAVVRVVGGG